MPYLTPGSLLAERYRIDAEIGRGGYSVVYRARDLRLESTVAIKFLVPPPATEAVAKERMRREALVARGLSHPNVVQLHDYVESDGHDFLVMQFVDGPDLARRVAEQGPLPAELAVALLSDVTSALGAAHEMGVLHRDVKPQNLLIETDGSCRLADFGSARVLDMETVTRTGGLVGTMAYTAPEILAGGRGDARSDLYSLGMTLYFALTGCLPDQASPPLPPAASPVGYRPRARNALIPAWLDDVTAMLTSQEPGRRHPTAASLLEALEAGDAARGMPAGGPSVRADCLLCGDPDPFGLGLCAACLGSEDAARPADQRLLFLERGEDRGHREAIADEVWSLAGEAADEARIRAALRGELPLARVAAGSAERAARHLRSYGLPVRVTHPARIGARLTTGLGLALGAAIGTGLVAGLYVAPPMLLITPAFAGVVAWAAVRRQSPALLAVERAADLPASARDIVRRTLHDLPKGAARSLYGDVTRMARSLYAASSADAAPGADGDGLGRQAELGVTLTELLRAAARLASDLAGLDESLFVMEAREVQAARADGEAGAADPAWMETHAGVTRTRDRLVQRLLDALAALGRAHAADLQADGEPGRRLYELSRELERDAAIQAEVRREIDALLV